MPSTLSLVHCGNLARYSDTGSLFDESDRCTKSQTGVRRAKPVYEESDLCTKYVHVPNRIQLQSTNSLPPRDPTFHPDYCLVVINRGLQDPVGRDLCKAVSQVVVVVKSTDLVKLTAFVLLQR